MRINKSNSESIVSNNASMTHKNLEPTFSNPKRIKTAFTLILIIHIKSSNHIELRQTKSPKIIQIEYQERRENYLLQLKRIQWSTTQRGVEAR